MYKLNNDSRGLLASIENLNSGAFIPFDAGNTDFRIFKADLAKGVELQDAEGAAMTAEQVSAFLATLP